MTKRFKPGDIVQVNRLLIDPDSEVLYTYEKYPFSAKIVEVHQIRSGYKKPWDYVIEQSAKLGPHFYVHEEDLSLIQENPVYVTSISSKYKF